MTGRRLGVDRLTRAKEGETGIALPEDADKVKLAEYFPKTEGAAVFCDDEPARRQKRSASKKIKNAMVLLGGGIGRIEENDVEQAAERSVFRGKALQASQGVELQNPRAPANAQGIEILLNERSCGRMIFDEYSFGGTTAERFDSHRAGAGEYIEEAAAGNLFSQNIKE